jgi:4-hydroxybenzoate polyprenyltransferase
MKRPLVAALWRAVRPHQWLSNLVVFAALVYSRSLLDFALLIRVVLGFLLLCGLSSATFLVNDVVDRERDRRHPVRRHRPVAAGELSARQAMAAAAVLAVVSLAGAFALQPAFGLAAAGYFLIMIGYSLGLRRVPALDVLAIATGLVLRAVAGALLIQVTISPWLYLAVGGLGLILALGRVQYEMRLAEATGALETSKYTLEAVEPMNHLAVAFTLIVYCLYTFLAAGLPDNHTMMLTIPIVIYGVFRYRYLTDQQVEGQSPERLMISDMPLLLTVGLWGLVALGVLYVGAGR